MNSHRLSKLALVAIGTFAVIWLTGAVQSAATQTLNHSATIPDLELTRKQAEV